MNWKWPLKSSGSLFSSEQGKACLFFFFLAMPRGLQALSSLEPRPQQWKCQVLTTGPPGNSLQKPVLSLLSVETASGMPYELVLFLTRGMYHPAGLLSQPRLLHTDTKPPFNYFLCFRVTFLNRLHASWGQKPSFMLMFNSLQCWIWHKLSINVFAIWIKGWGQI